MAKKKQTKKHNFKYSSPTTTGDIPLSSISQPGSPEIASKFKSSKPAMSLSENFSYVSHDLRRIAIFAGALIAVEIIVWWSFDHTSLGNSVYSLIKL